ncbi:unnamed protein product [Eruca vesicaria subsp. sativa]|uniref:Uncharacterized protein n=1 Tax=Eruca vesicaria subsp. sativa TaxID=29727 RepID=A0ABC8K613_ERUVS|nr:unnamed protein product [Eruca vesicaria subsp. sativa]
METETIFMTIFLITSLVSYVYPSFGQQDVDDEPLVNSGHEFDSLDTISPASEDYNIYMLENFPPKYKTYLQTFMDKIESNGNRKCYMDVLK